MPDPRFSLSNDQLIELEDLIAHAAQPEVRRRAQIIRLLYMGYRPSHIARDVGVSRRTVYNVLHNFEHYGIDGLYDRPRSGRPRKLTSEHCALLEAALAEDPAAFGYETPGWTTIILQQHVEHTTGIRLSTPRIGALLRQLGYAYRRHPARVEALITGYDRMSIR
ncbi:MAG: transposase, partial [Chloroflexi bacterium]|nr:transposase [Chloroflexota bacterium]